jgi:hypothetical protein
MTTSASALPALPTTNDDMRKVSERMNVLIRWFNRPDLFVPSYAADTGSGTAYVTTPSADIKFYEVGQEFDFIAANANTSAAPTLAVQGLAAGTITYPDGSALLPGDIAANSFNTVGVTSTTPTFQLLSAAGGRSKLLQTVSTEIGAVNTGTTQLPVDDTIPQNNEGDQYMSLAITPKSASSKLIIDVVWMGAASIVAGAVIGALFQDSTANAIAAAWAPSLTANTAFSIIFRHVMTSGTTSATTFKLRVGTNAAGTITFNGSGAARFLGGVMASSIVIQEVLP